MAQAITEEDDIQAEWYKESKDITLETLPAFLAKLTADYEHDYGTIVHAVAAGAIAAACAINKSPTGGITGFQAGAVMWQFITEWNLGYKDKPLRLVDYSQMLYPQHEHDFQRTITQSTWTYLKEQAVKELKGFDGHSKVKAHLQSIIDGIIPFNFTVKEDH